MIIKHFFYFKDIVSKLNALLDRQKKWLGVGNVLLSMLNAVFQLLSVVVFAPLISMMVSPNAIEDNRVLRQIGDVFRLSESAELFFTIAIITIVLYLIKSVSGIVCVWYTNKYAHMIERTLSIETMRLYLLHNYDYFVEHGVAKIQRDVQTDPTSVFYVINGLLSMVNELFVVVILFLYIAIADFQLAICILTVAVTSLMVFYVLLRKIVKKQGVRSRNAQAVYNKVFLQTVGGIKEIQVMRKQQFFLKQFNIKTVELHKPRVIGEVVSLSPYYAIEGIFMTGIIAYICLRYVSDASFVEQMPLFASFAMGAVRMLPSIGRISNNVNTLLYNMPALNAVYDRINELRSIEKEEGTCNEVQRKESSGVERKSGEDSLAFRELILKDVSFHYQNKTDIMQDVNLHIRRGNSVGIIGPSGAGKSTLADLILGLHHPQHGSISVNGYDISDIPDVWSEMIGYVPQSIYLSDGTIRENVAFGVEEKNIDNERVWKSLVMAQLGEYVENLEKGLNTLIGERGVRISGGQQQRIAIARALYRDPQVLVFDEATSALDTETEEAVMKTVESLYGILTTIIIAHRLSTIMKCDIIYEIKNGTVCEITKDEIKERLSTA